MTSELTAPPRSPATTPPVAACLASGRLVAGIRRPLSTELGLWRAAATRDVRPVLGRARPNLGRGSVRFPDAWRPSGRDVSRASRARRLLHGRVMTTQPCRMGEAWIRAMVLMCEDDLSRRAWLWLRAREKEDDEALECLERGEPGLRARMAPYDARAQAIDDPRKRRLEYARMMDEMTLEVS